MKLKNVKNHPLFKYFFSSKRIIILFIFSFITAVLAGFMEGISYGSLLLAVNVLRGEIIESIPIFTFLNSFIQILSINKQFLFFIILALFIQFIRSSFMFTSQYIVAQLSLKITTAMQIKIYNQIFNFSYPFVSKYQAGDLLNYNTSPTIIPVILSQLNIALSSIIIGGISLFWLIKIDPILTSLLLFFFFLVNFLYKIILKKLNNLSVNLSSNEVKFSAKNNENINGIKLIHMFNRQNEIVTKTVIILKKIAKSISQINFWKTLITSFGEIIGIIVIGLMLIVGAFLLRHKDSFISYLLMFIFIAYRLSVRMQIFMTCIGDVISYKGPLKRLSKILNNEDKEFLSNSELELKSFANKIQINDVSFSYEDRKKTAIENFSYAFLKGKTYAIIGKSGSGKSTLIDLLLNLYQPKKGSIKVDNIELDKISLNSWRSKIGIVNQDIFLFHDTIIDNIKFGKENTSFQDIKQVAILAHADEFISKLPKKYHTIVGEKGHKLSGGERQRIALARALIKNPDILILDEATSHLDTHSEKLIQKAIENLRQEKTIIIIAHRLSTIINADEILVMNNGKLIETGTHNELINRDEQYAYFWRIQSKN